VYTRGDLKKTDRKYTRGDQKNPIENREQVR